jgi:hypothetical protein
MKTPVLKSLVLAVVALSLVVTAAASASSANSWGLPASGAATC